MAGRGVSQRYHRRLRWLALIPGSLHREPSHLSTGWSSDAIGFLDHARRPARFEPWFGDMSVIISLSSLIVGCDDSSVRQRHEGPLRYPADPAFGSEDRPFGLDHVRVVTMRGANDAHRARINIVEAEPAEIVGYGGEGSFGVVELDGGRLRRGDLPDDSARVASILDIDGEGRRLKGEHPFPGGTPNPGERLFACRVEGDLGEFGLDRSPGECGHGEFVDICRNGVSRVQTLP